MHVNIYKVPRLQLTAVSKVNSLTRLFISEKGINLLLFSCFFQLGSC